MSETTPSRDAHERRSVDPASSSRSELERRRAAIRGWRRLATADQPAALERIAADVVAELVDADQGRCVFHDAEAAVLWSTVGDAAWASDLGVVGWVARTGSALTIATASRDPRWHATLDGTAANARILAVAVRDGDGAVTAVLVASRGPRRSPFTPVELAAAEALAELAPPIFAVVAADVEAAAALASTEPRAIFRREAIEAHRGDALGRPPTPRSRWALALPVALLALLIAAAIYGWVARVPAYTRGHGVIRRAAHVELRAAVPGGARARLAVGQRLRFELVDFARAYQDAVVTSIAPHEFSAAEAARALGVERSALPQRGPLVLITARVGPELRVGGRAHPFADGMRAAVAVEIGSASLVEALRGEGGP